MFNGSRTVVWNISIDQSYM